MQAYSAVIVAICVALVLTILFVVLGSRGPWGSFWTLFLILFLAIWATGLYVSPIGPVYWGVPWVPIISAGVLFAILLIAVMPDSGTRRRIKDGRLRNESKEADPNYDPDKMATTNGAGIGAFFWILIMLLTVVIIVGMI